MFKRNVIIAVFDVSDPKAPVPVHREIPTSKDICRVAFLQLASREVQAM
jgi:hypothetical protein